MELTKTLSFFENSELFKQALIHKSFSYENKMSGIHNEKLEFLGDAVIDLIVGELLLDTFPSDTEGSLSKKRASLVNESVLAEIAQSHFLGEKIKLGKGELQNQGAQKPRILSSTYEAVVGAIYKDFGFEEARNFLRKDFESFIDKIKTQIDYECDYKTRLQELAQKIDKSTPEYILVSEEGPSHSRIFTVDLKIQNEVLSQGTGKSKKSAEQNAAENALKLQRWNK